MFKQKGPCSEVIMAPRNTIVIFSGFCICNLDLIYLSLRPILHMGVFSTQAGSSWGGFSKSGLGKSGSNLKYCLARVLVKNFFSIQSLL